MRIGFNASLVAGQPFGVSRCILELARGLARTRADGELVVYSSEAASRAFELSTPEGGAVRVVVVRQRMPCRLGRILWEQLRLPSIARRDGVDLLHAPGYVMPVQASLPVVLTVYDILALTHRHFCKPTNVWHYGMALPLSIRRAARIVTPSSAVRDQVMDRFAVEADRICVIPPGVDERFRTSPSEEELRTVKRRYRLPDHFALFVGNWEPKKNLARLADAFLELRQRDELDDGELVLTGGGGWGNVLRDRVDRPGIRRLPYVPQDDLAALYRLARLLAFPSLAEGFGLPVVEAMASGLPVLCSEIPALGETDPNAVLSVDPTSTHSIARGLRRLWNDDELRAALAERGREATRHLSWEQAARRTWQLYRELLAE